MDQKNLIVAIALSVVIILGWQFIMAPSPEEQRREAAEKQRQIDEQRKAQPVPGGQPAAPQASPAPQAPGSPPQASAPAPSSFLDRADALKRSPRVTFRTPELEGSIALKGARIDDVRLVKHRVTVDPKSGMVPVLSPEGAYDAYYAEFGWALKPGSSVKVPGPDSVWTADRQTLEPGQPSNTELGQWRRPDLPPADRDRSAVHVHGCSRSRTRVALRSIWRPTVS